MLVGVVTLPVWVINLVLDLSPARARSGARRTPVVAMLLLAGLPLGRLCAAGSFANDVVLTTYCFAAFYVFRRSLREKGGTIAPLASAAASGVFLFFGFVTKPWVILVAPLFVAEGVARARRHWAVVPRGVAARWACSRAGPRLAVAPLRRSLPSHQRRAPVRDPRALQPLHTLQAYPRMLFQAK